MVGSIVIKVELQSLQKFIRACNRVQRAIEREKHALPMRQALDYRDLLRLAIITQKYASSYPPYNPRYEDWKTKYFAATGFLVMRSIMVSNLTVYRGRYKNWVYAGLPPGLVAPGSSWFGPPGIGKTPQVSMYAWVNEYGGNWGYGYHPPRPVWRPTKEEYKREGFINRGKESLEVIRRSWQ